MGEGAQHAALWSRFIRVGFLLGLAAGCAAALFTVSLALFPSPVLLLLLFPGLSLNLFGLPFWLCPLGNLVFWFLLCWGGAALIARSILLYRQIFDR